MKTWKIPVTWELTGIVEIEAETIEQAIKNFDQQEDEFGIELPTHNQEYVDSSFRREDETTIRLNNI